MHNKKMKESKCVNSYFNYFLRVCFMISLLFLLRSDSMIAEAATDVNVNYVNGLATITSNDGSTKFYVSVDNGKTWEALDSNVLDITSFLKPKDFTLYFKGNNDPGSKTYYLQGEDQNIKASYQVANGVGRIAITNVSSPVEYRNGPNGQWLPLNGYSIDTTNYEFRGTTINVRIAATPIKRAGKIINVRVPKKPSAPSVRYDGSKLAFTGLRSGQTQYRVGNSATWLTFTPSALNTTVLDAKSAFGSVLTGNTQTPAGTIEFRTAATVKQVASSIKYIEVPIQPLVPDTITVMSNTLIILDCSPRKAYEYTVVNPGAVLNLSTARWTSVTTSSAVKINNVKLGSFVYIRVKSYTDPTSKNIIPASTYKEAQITSISM